MRRTGNCAPLSAIGMYVWATVNGMFACACAPCGAAAPATSAAVVCSIWRRRSCLIVFPSAVRVPLLLASRQVVGDRRLKRSVKTLVGGDIAVGERPRFGFGQRRAPLRPRPGLDQL